MSKLLGIHHVSAITSSAPKIYNFFTNVLGMRLVKKTVNQDDIFTYHLFFADNRGNPGTGMTFFEFKNIHKGEKGTNTISRTGFRVPSDEALNYFKARFDYYHVVHQDIITLFGAKTLFFTGIDGDEYALVSDEHNVGVASGEPWANGPVPNEYAITGLGPIWLTVNNEDRMNNALTGVLKMEKKAVKDNLVLYEMGEGGNGARVIVVIDKESRSGLQGFGSVHHVAFRVKDQADLKSFIPIFNNALAPHSGFVDRFYFASLYTRLYPEILFELATDGPGFIDDEESIETLGEHLALPPHLRHKRDIITKVITPIDTRNVKREKEGWDFINGTSHT